MMGYQKICFDLDGTLTDPKLGITKSVQYALKSFGIEVADLDELEPFIGPPLKGSFMEQYGMSEEDAVRAIAYYREYFREQGMLENEIYPGIPALLRDLRLQGKKLMVATSKPTVFAVPILEHFQIAHYFEEIAGSELDGTRSDKAEVIQHVLERHPLACTQVVMIGDRKHDIIGAHKNQIDSIGVAYGYGSMEELKQSKPVYIVDTVEQLAALLGVNERCFVTDQYS